MALGTLTRLVQADATTLGIIRAGVSGVFLIAILFTSVSDFGYLPVTIFNPTGVMQIFSWGFYDRLVTPGGMAALKCAMVLSLLMSTVGYLTRISSVTSALLILFFQGLLRNWRFTHDEMLGVYFLIILACTPCGDGFSVDSLPGADRRRRKSFVYGYPILLMQALMAWSYFSSAVIKLRVAGLSYLDPDKMPTYAIIHSLDNLHDTQFRLAFLLPSYRDVVPLAVSLILVWELLFPLAVVWKRARWAFLLVGVLFHFSTMFLMNIFFPYTLAMYLVFVDWPRWMTRVAQAPLLKHATSWWRDFRNVPETFPELTVSDKLPRRVLLWDGDCGFCKGWVKRLQRFAGRPFEAHPYQSFEKELQPELLNWSRKQMHWIDASGKVVGGSRALVSVLAESGHCFLAALLESAPLRPFAWFGYRVVARNRG